MAVSSKESQANIQSLLDQGVSQDFINSQIAGGGYGSKINPNEVQRILSAYQATPQDVFTTSNINQTATSPIPAPDDLLGIRSQINTELGIPGLQTSYQTAYQDLLNAKAAAREQQTALSNLPQALGVIRGEQAIAGEQASNRISALSDAAAVAQSALQAAQQEASAQFGIRQGEVEQKRSIILQYPGAGITFGDSFDTIANKLDTYQTKIAEEEQKTAYKNSLKNIALELGLKTKGSTKELEKRISKANKAALEQAKKESDLKLEQMRMDIENTKSLISERSKKSDSNSDSNIVKDARADIASLIMEGKTPAEQYQVISTLYGDDLSDGEIQSLIGAIPGVNFTPVSQFPEDTGSDFNIGNLVSNIRSSINPFENLNASNLVNRALNR